MTLDDIDQILEIEQKSFPTPWSRKSFEHELTNNHFASYYVIENNEGVFGYCGIWFIMDEGHITNVAILPKYRGNKYGEALFSHMVNIAKAEGVKLMTLEVRVSNNVAQNMYRKYGMVPGGIRKNYYSDNGEDALVMWVNL